jgi:signal transduction histidine kinase
MAQDWSLSFLVTIYRDQGNYEEALKYSIKGTTYNRYFSKSVWNTITGSVFQEMNEIDSALNYLHQGDLGGYNLLQLGHTYAKIGNKILASDFYTKSIPKLLIFQNFKDLADAYISLARLYEKENNIDSSIYFANKGLIISQKASFKKWVYETGLILSRVYEKNDAGKALYYHKLAIAARDSMFNLQNITQSLNARFNEQLSKQQAQTEKISYQSKLRTQILLGALAFFLLVAVILWRNNRQKQKAKTEIEKAYQNLKSAQSQLIQSEKMASLGELTAGIAHEIQNPLNFVNNFSEVNKELIGEMRAEIEKGNLVEVKLLAKDIEDNEEKIGHHGKRADAIVKGMLQHSLTSSGVKEFTDIKALADEYLRLAYHGLRAKDKSFNADLKTDFDPELPKVHVVFQDIGRVLLNLINNAFYAVNEKSKEGTADFKPQVEVATQKTEKGIEISVKDNGNGIPDSIKEKIFQPFFTTKPTGQETGLGLSLSYDIVKAHGGELNLKTKESDGSEFTIVLPMVKL